MRGLQPIPQEEWHQSQRGYFAGTLYNEMLKNKNIWLIVGDLGYKVFDRIMADMPERFLNTGAAEFAMLDIAVGLSLQGKIPFVYSITPFLLYRPFEVIRTYINHESLNVKLVGSGRNDDYAHDGFSHYAGDDVAVMRLFENIAGYWPPNKEEVPELVEDMVYTEKPLYLNLTR